MSIDLNGISNRVITSTPDNNDVKTDRTLSEPPVAQQATGGSSTADTVSITDTANQLKALEANVAQLPVVDTQRVEAAREAIDSGQYKVNPENVADRLLAFENQLSG